MLNNATHTSILPMPLSHTSPLTSHSITHYQSTHISIDSQNIALQPPQHFHTLTILPIHIAYTPCITYTPSQYRLHILPISPPYSHITFTSSQYHLHVLTSPSHPHNITCPHITFTSSQYHLPSHHLHILTISPALTSQSHQNPLNRKVWQTFSSPQRTPICCMSDCQTSCYLSKMSESLRRLEKVCPFPPPPPPLP